LLLLLLLFSLPVLCVSENNDGHLKGRECAVFVCGDTIAVV